MDYDASQVFAQMRFQAPLPNTHVIIIGDYFYIYSPKKVPNWWHRFWLKKILGIRVEILK
jgi:hypothetical protein